MFKHFILQILHFDECTYHGEMETATNVQTQSGHLLFVGYSTSLSLTRSALILDHLDAHADSRHSSQSVCGRLMVLTNHHHIRSVVQCRLLDTVV